MTAAPMFQRITHVVEKSQLYPLVDGSRHRHGYSKPEQELSAWPAADPTPLRHLNQPARASVDTLNCRNGPPLYSLRACRYGKDPVTTVNAKLLQCVVYEGLMGRPDAPPPVEPSGSASILHQQNSQTEQDKLSYWGPESAIPCKAALTGRYTMSAKMPSNFWELRLAYEVTSAGTQTPPGNRNDKGRQDFGNQKQII
ncbi:hypothetical protein KC331_g12101 [Hortaea werneckii]|nr:hypothetical protein KC331_g12101 [Hortaea werneckii]KAI7707380.1 hypothetical protein KC353_g11666 [Hortaea werneckii]